LLGGGGVRFEDIRPTSADTVTDLPTPAGSRPVDLVAIKEGKIAVEYFANRRVPISGFI